MSVIDYGERFLDEVRDRQIEDSFCGGGYGKVDEAEGSHEEREALPYHMALGVARVIAVWMLIVVI